MTQQPDFARLQIGGEEIGRGGRSVGERGSLIPQAGGIRGGEQHPLSIGSERDIADVGDGRLVMPEGGRVTQQAGRAGGDVECDQILRRGDSLDAHRLCHRGSTRLQHADAISARGGRGRDIRRSPAIVPVVVGLVGGEILGGGRLHQETSGKIGDLELDRFGGSIDAILPLHPERQLTGGPRNRGGTHRGGEVLGANPGTIQRIEQSRGIEIGHPHRGRLGFSRWGRVPPIHQGPGGGDHLVRRGEGANVLDVIAGVDRILIVGRNPNELRLPGPAGAGVASRSHQPYGTSGLVEHKQIGVGARLQPVGIGERAARRTKGRHMVRAKHHVGTIGR